MTATHVVGISDCRVADDADATLVTYALGSCVGLSLYDPVAVVGGILHVMLPDSQFRSSSREFNPHMYADTGFYSLLESLVALGADKRRLVAKAAGGANMLRHSAMLDIGSRNAEAVLGLLRLESIPVAATSLGGTFGRSMQLTLRDGSVHVRLLGHGEETL